MKQTRKVNRKSRMDTRKRKTRAIKKGGADDVDIKLSKIDAKDGKGNIVTKNTVYELYLKPTGDVITYYMDGINDYLMTITGKMKGSFNKQEIFSKKSETKTDK